MSKKALTKAIQYMEGQQSALSARSVDERGVWRCMSDEIHHSYLSHWLIPDLVKMRDSMPDDEASPSEPEPSMAPMANVIRAPQRGGGKP